MDLIMFFHYKNFYHFRDFPEDGCSFPWAVPDQFISSHEIKARTTVAIFGAKEYAYDVNWCRQQCYVKGYDLSGVENKTVRRGVL
jgi:hypothetical protein